MTRQEVFTRLDEVFQDVFDNEEIHVSDETRQKTLRIGTAWSTSA